MSQFRSSSRPHTLWDSEQLRLKEMKVGLWHSDTFSRIGRPTLDPIHRRLFGLVCDSVIGKSY